MKMTSGAKSYLSIYILNRKLMPLYKTYFMRKNPIERGRDLGS